MQEYCIKFSSNICFGYLLESPHWGDSNKYPKHMFYDEIQIKQGLSYISVCSLKSLQQQIHFNGNIFENKCCRCKEGLLQILNEAEIMSYLCSADIRVSSKIACAPIEESDQPAEYHLLAASEGSHQTAWMRKLIWLFAVGTLQSCRKCCASALVYLTLRVSIYTPVLLYESGV